MTFIDKINNVLLVEPDFPIPAKSRNHSNFLPIGLLKIASHLRKNGMTPHLIRFDRKNPPIEQVKPDLICVTSLFTYWSKYVKEVVQYYKQLYPNVRIDVGGIYATLMPNHCKEYTGCDNVIIGVLPEAEECTPAYDLVDVDYQIIHSTRGCVRNCEFCGTYIIEPEFQYKKSIKREVIKKKLVFYDNNILANPHIENILTELRILKSQHKTNYVESQSGFDGRILLRKPKLAKMIREAGFKNIKIAWDGGIEEADTIHQQIQLLLDAGYHDYDIFIFVLYNYKISFEEMEEKRLKCAEWGIRISDCRYRPLDATSDEYDSHKKSQTGEDYFIYPTWTDTKVRNFRRNIRRHNVCLKWGTEYFSYIIEKRKLSHEDQEKIFYMGYPEIRKIIPKAWGLHEYHPPEEGFEKEWYDVPIVKKNLKEYFKEEE